MIRLLCFGDNHGNAQSMMKAFESIEPDRFDAVIHTGDITNLVFADSDELQSQVQPLYETIQIIQNEIPFYYVLGNRDYTIGRKPRTFSQMEPSFEEQFLSAQFQPGSPVQKGTTITDKNGNTIPNQSIIDIIGEPFPGNRIPENETIDLNGIPVTQHPRLAQEQNGILVTHYFLKELIIPFAGTLYLSGHIHSGHRRENVVNTGFLHRHGEHESDHEIGEAFEIELGESIHVQPVGLGGLTPAKRCSTHGATGKQYAPSSWSGHCRYCYEPKTFYLEMAFQVHYFLLHTMDREPTVNDVIETGIEWGESYDHIAPYVPQGFTRHYESKVNDHFEDQ